MNITELNARKRAGEKLTMVTCYDAWSARLLAETSVDMILVGDSAAMVMHGHADTVAATVDLLAPHVRAVRIGAPNKFIVADLPFLAYRGSLDASLAAVRRLMQEGAHAVKIEGYDPELGELIARLTRAGVPVMGHLGLTPQFVNAFGGFRVQGRSEEQRQHILSEAQGLASAGAFALVLECVPQRLATEATAALAIPTIGIGAGLDCDGQVLVLQDLLGLSVGHRPKFVRPYMDGSAQVKRAVDSFCEDVRAGRFPTPAESYS